MFSNTPEVVNPSRSFFTPCSNIGSLTLSWIPRKHDGSKLWIRSLHALSSTLYLKCITEHKFTVFHNSFLFVLY